MDFVDETRMTRWASICLFYTIFLILMALADVDIVHSKWDIPLLLVLLLQLLFLGIFTFQPRSGSLQLYKYRLQINFLGQWMLPTLACSLSLVCISIVVCMKYKGKHKSLELNENLAYVQISLHCLHFLNLLWGFLYFLRAPRAGRYDPTLPADAKTSPLLLSNEVSLSTSSYLSKAYINNRQSHSSARNDQERSSITEDTITTVNPETGRESSSCSSPSLTNVCLKFPRNCSLLIFSS